LHSIDWHMGNWTPTTEVGNIRFLDKMIECPTVFVWKHAPCNDSDRWNQFLLYFRKEVQAVLPGQNICILCHERFGRKWLDLTKEEIALGNAAWKNYYLPGTGKKSKKKRPRYQVAWNHGRWLSAEVMTNLRIMPPDNGDQTLFLIRDWQPLSGRQNAATSAFFDYLFQRDDVLVLCACPGDEESSEESASASSSQ